MNEFPIALPLLIIRKGVVLNNGEIAHGLIFSCDMHAILRRRLADGVFDGLALSHDLPDIAAGNNIATAHLSGSQGLIGLIHGLRIRAPVGSKSATFRITLVMPCTSAVAAISPSRIGRGSGT